MLELITVLRAACPELDVWSVGDALWLAAAEDDQTQTHSMPVDRSHPEARKPVQQNEPATPAEPSTGSLFETLPTSTAVHTGQAVTITRTRGLADTMAIGRALQPFMGRWPRGPRAQLDIDATVDSYTQSGILVPVMASEPERWFVLVVVTDTTASMAVWHEQIAEFTTLLRGMGAFQEVISWSLNSDTAELTNNRGRQVGPVTRAVNSPGSRRLVLLVSDFAGQGWQDAPAWLLLRTLAATTPTVLVNPLPRRLWRHSGLRHPIVRARTKTIGARNADLEFPVPLRLQALDEPIDDWSPIPVAALTARSLARLSQTIMRAELQGCDAVLVPASGYEPNPQEATSTTSTTELTDAFLRTASPAAARLSVLCSPFESLSLPLLHLVCRAAVPEAGLTDIAEFLVSGLLVIEQPDSHAPVLSLYPQAATRLSAYLTYHDAWQTMDAITRHITEHSRATRTRSTDGVLAVVNEPGAGLAITAELRPFAAASNDLRRVLGITTPLNSWNSAAIRGEIRTFLETFRSPDLRALARRFAHTGFTADATAWDIIDFLSGLDPGADGIPPALAFIKALSATLNPLKQGSTLNDWADTNAHRLGIDVNSWRWRALDPAIVIPPLHLCIAIEPEPANSRTLVISHWRQDDPYAWPPTPGVPLTVDANDLERATADLVMNTENAWIGYGGTPRLEFILPRSLLNLPVHRWRNASRSGTHSPLCADYPVAVRSLERMRARHWHRSWQARWSQFEEDPSAERLYFVGQFGNTHPIDAVLSDEHWVSVALSAPPTQTIEPGREPDDLTAALRSGIPLVLWNQQSVDIEWMRTIVRGLTEVDGLADLTSRIHKLRLEALAGTIPSTALDLVLLWDDPRRVLLFEESWPVRAGL
ncbi:SAV_2336 N-terminal domain-related protein [Amycolatopsis sp. lyj-90]|uniref:SAV_2336 N-terminal domain-related protein n=1 Tax=Amycolatopsis sp. lyj-90 TaxID=2789285 RepID=UPI00397CD26A